MGNVLDKDNLDNHIPNGLLLTSPEQGQNVASFHRTIVNITEVTV